MQAFRSDKVNRLPLKPINLDQSLCSDCETAVMFAQLYLSSNSTITEINKMVATFCKTILPNNPNQCITIANMGIKYLLNFINNNSPEVICQDLKICTSVQNMINKLKISEEGTVCSLCEAVLQVLETELLSEPVQNEVLTLLDNACNLLPSSWASECHLALLGLVPELITALINNFPPQKLCGYATLC